MTPVMPMSALRDGAVSAWCGDGVELVVCRVDGRYFAVEGHCPHAGQSLRGARLAGHELICPLHGARFDVRDGRCVRAPADRGLVTYPVIIDGGKVHVDLTRPRPPR
jgi:nitrite reductase/ring-hydroxylating ferredoxin subunit